MKTSKPFPRWFPAILMMAVIFTFSSIPSTALPSFSYADLIVKKGGHMLGYGLLAMSYLYGLQGNPSRKARIPEKENLWLVPPMIFAWVFSVLYALTDEFHQSIVPGRNASLVDIGIDALGAAVMLLIYNIWKRHRGN